MPGTTPPPLSLALAVLRSAQGWTQGELGAALGLSGKMLSRYETGRSVLSRERLETMVAAMGCGPEAIDQTLLFLQQILTEPDALPQPLGPTKEERRIIERAAAAKGLAEAEAAREELLRSLTTLRAGQARRQAQQLWEYLKSRPARERRVLIEGAREYRSWALCELLSLLSEKTAAHHAREAVELAELAVRVAELAPGEEAFRSGLQGYAWAYLANSRRVQGNHPSADAAFARSDGFLSLGAPAISGLLNIAVLPDLKASLRRHQDRIAEALQLHEQALRLAKPEDHGCILLNKARTLDEMQRYGESLETLKQAEAMIDAQNEPRHFVALQFKRAHNLVHLERYMEAEALLPRVKGLVAQLGTGLDALRLRWLEGKIAAGLGRRDEALAAFSQVRGEFITRGIAFDTALVTLDLASVHLEMGHSGEVKTLAREMVAIFESQGGQREALSALRLFYRAAERERATLDLVRQLIEYLHRARHDPRLRFEGGRS